MHLFRRLFDAIRGRVHDFAREVRISHHRDEGKWHMVRGDIDGAHRHYNRMHNEINARSPRMQARHRAQAVRRELKP